MSLSTHTRWWGKGPGWSLATPRLDDRSPAAFKVQGPVRVGEVCETTLCLTDISSKTASMTMSAPAKCFFHAGEPSVSPTSREACGDVGEMWGRCGEIEPSVSREACASCV